MQARTYIYERKETRYEQWLQRAEEDPDTADFLRDRNKDDYAAFLYQQAVEKRRKYVILNEHDNLPQIHDCHDLATRADTPEMIREKADVTTPYYFRTRYPDINEDEITPEEIDDVKTAAHEVIQWIHENYSENPRRTHKRNKRRRSVSLRLTSPRHAQQRQ